MGILLIIGAKFGGSSMAKNSFVNLNMNPCKMCMPMGAALAFKGIENSILLLHGSQGCSTYIRRHMTGHYNEPIDIGSSSLSEEGTVYGGESNLKKALKNIIKVYNPSIIGVATTCLAETIGEDIKRIVNEFKNEEDIGKLKIVPVPTPGYGGTQFEGYFLALKEMVFELAKNNKANGKINVIVNNLNPGDVRNIKEILNSFKASYTIFPDVSETLDAPYTKVYTRIPVGGTRIREIEDMPGASATIEFGFTVNNELSPGQYLMDKWGVKLFRCPVPIGIENTDIFMSILSEITGKLVPDNIQKEKGRLIDGMIDSHKFNAEGRAVIYGEPEMVYSLGKLCFENGIKPVLISTGTKNKALNILAPGTKFEEKPLIIDDTDFNTIRHHANELDANILIGNSDGKVITEKDGIPLVRVGFPVHDRVGAQRQVYTGYNGTLRLLDDITNTLIENKYNNYRKDMFDKHFEDEVDDVDEKTASHPCYSGGCQNARMHLPVAPACNISCNYCNRKYDCQNESRPGVTSKVLSPKEALEKFIQVREKVKNLKVIGIAGPGDALANFEETKRTLEMIRTVDTDITFCLSTNGLMLINFADELVRLGVTHVTITINAIDPAVGALIYKHINFMGVTFKGEAAAKILINNQLAGLKYLSSMGVVCKVNIVMIKGVNDNHIEDVVEKVKECGAFMTNIMPLIPAGGSVFENMPMTSNKELNELRKKCNIHLKQMYHCKQCRADAIGTLDDDISSEFMNNTCNANVSDITSGDKPEFTFAVASKTNMYVDQHFGYAESLYIYKYSEAGVKLIEQRKINKYCLGSSDCDQDDKITSIKKYISDCNAVIVMRIGFQPLKELESAGVKVIQTCERIEDAIKNAAEELSKTGFVSLK